MATLQPQPTTQLQGQLQVVQTTSHLSAATNLKLSRSILTQLRTIINSSRAIYPRTISIIRKKKQPVAAHPKLIDILIEELNNEAIYEATHIKFDEALRYPYRYEDDDLESLPPPYKSSVFMEGKVEVKLDIPSDAPNSTNTNQRMGGGRGRWFKVHLTINGTLLTIKPIQPTKVEKLKSKLRNFQQPSELQWSVNGLKVLPYNNPTFPYRFKIKLADNAVYSVQPMIRDEDIKSKGAKNSDAPGLQKYLYGGLTKVQLAQLWVDALQSSANIAPDLEFREIPRFRTLPARASRTRA